MRSPIARIPPPLFASFISPPPKWLDSDDDFEHEPALISDDALSSGCSRAPSLAPLDWEDPHIDIVSSPVQDTFFRTFPSSRTAPLSRYNTSGHAKSPTTREDVAAALLALRAQPRLGSSRSALPDVRTQPAAETLLHHLPPVRRSRVVSPSLRNLVLPRTPSPPPRPPLPTTMTNSPPIIDLGHKTTPSPHIALPAPASSPLPPSSPFTEEDEYEGPASTRFHSLSSPRPEHLQVDIPTDNSETDESASLSRDREAKEDNNDSHLITHDLIPAKSSLAPSLLPEGTPDPSLAHTAPLLPLPSDTCSLSLPADSSLVPAPVPSTPQTLPAGPPADESSRHGPLTCPSVSPTRAPTPPTDIIPDSTQTDAVPPHSRAPSPTLTALHPDPDPCLDPEHRSPPHHHHHHHPTSSPLSSPPTSPSPEHHHQRRTHTPPLPLKRPSSPEEEEEAADTDTDIVEPTSTSTRARSKRRRRDVHADDKPWRDRKKKEKHAHATAAAASTPPPRLTTTSTTPPPSSPSEPCPHPALLGLLLETLALSRASSLTQSALVKTNPALAPSTPAVLATTLKWAVQARVLGCVRSSGEALPPSYFYDPAVDPDRERGELLRCLMPRAGKRRETMKYKQYYWAPVVVGRGRTRTWDVDWEE